MFQTLLSTCVFATLLAFPCVWRIVLGTLLGLSLRSAGGIALFVAPHLAILVPLGLLTYSTGSEGIFIPVMLLVCWGPQLLVLAFFAWCESEESESNRNRGETAQQGPPARCRK